MLSIILLFLFMVVFVSMVIIGQKNAVAEWHVWWVNSVDGWVRLFCRYYHRLQHEMIPLPECGAALIVSNHTSGLDPFLIIAASPRPVRFIIAEEEYQRFGLRWFFRAIGCIPIQRGGNVTKAMAAAITALKNGEVIAIFPEGVIHIPGEKQKPLKRGVAVLAEASNTPIYPVRISGVRGVGHVFRGVILRGTTHMQTAKAIDCADNTHKQCLIKIVKMLRPE